MKNPTNQPPRADEFADLLGESDEDFMDLVEYDPVPPVSQQNKALSAEAKKEARLWAFLDALARTASVKRALEAVNVDPPFVYKARRRPAGRCARRAGRARSVAPRERGKHSAALSAGSDRFQR